MKITEKQTRTIEEEITKDIICNKCGESLKDKCDMNFEGLQEIFVSGGYASLLGDMVEFTFSMCEKCLKVLFRSFKIPCEVYDLMDGLKCDQEEILKSSDEKL